MPKIEILNQEGKSLRTLDLNETVFGVEPSTQAMFDAVVMQQASKRQGTHSTKTESEVRGGGRKPWRQKGTGRARAGSIRAPHWRGGGLPFGPKPRNYGYKLNRKVRRLALKSALSQKVIDNDLLILEDLNFEKVKTKDFVKVMDALNVDRKVLFVATKDEDTNKAHLSMKNIKNASLLTIEGLNIYDIMNANKIVFTEKAAVEAGEVFA